jgi:hypothetical protein
MSAAQLQHLKLWFAGNAKNWDLAAYELLLLKDSLVEAALLYPDIPMSNVVKTLEGPLQSVSDAIKAKDSRKFASSVRELTEGCNSCHLDGSRLCRNKVANRPAGTRKSGLCAPREAVNAPATKIVCQSTSIIRLVADCCQFLVFCQSGESPITSP